MVILKLKNIIFWKKIYHYKSPIILDDVDFDNVNVIGEKIYKCFIGYLHDDYKIKLLHIMLPKMSSFVKSYEIETKLMYFLIKNDGLLNKCNTI